LESKSEEYQKKGEMIFILTQCSGRRYLKNKKGVTKGLVHLDGPARILGHAIIDLYGFPERITRE